ncbi:MAG TPA: hypothetical protein VFY87_02960, partial [Geminicoccaceae bacterium]|nr:hypothetical protein [Geminicoccaceae bacterium]
IYVYRPECVSWAPNRIDCFTIGNTVELGQELFHRWWDGTGWSTANTGYPGWEYLGGGPKLDGRRSRLRELRAEPDRLLLHRLRQ